MSVSYDNKANPGKLDLAAARILAGTQQVFEQETEELQDSESVGRCFEEAQAASAATEVTRSRFFNVFMVFSFFP